MALLGDIKATFEASDCYSRTKMAEKKRPRPGNLTPEGHARHERIMEMVRERIADHEARARDEDEARERDQP